MLVLLSFDSCPADAHYSKKWSPKARALAKLSAPLIAGVIVELRYCKVPKVLGLFIRGNESRGIINSCQNPFTGMCDLKYSGVAK